MFVVDPLTIDDTVLTASSIAEPDTSIGEQTYSGAATYANGDKAISTTLHWEWQSLEDGNTGNALPALGESDAHWLSVGPTNRYRMFYLNSTVATVGASPLTVTLEPGARTDTVGMDGLIADSVTITVSVSAVVIWSATMPLRTRNTLTWSDYLWGRFFQVNEAARSDLPPRYGATIALTFTRTSGDVSVGRMVLGRKEFLGDAGANANSSVINYSTWDRGTNGESSFVPRRNVPTIKVQTISDKARNAKLRKLRDELNAKISLWSWLDDSTDKRFGAGLVIGSYNEMSINADYPEYDITSYEIEGA